MQSPPTDCLYLLATATYSSEDPVSFGLSSSASTVTAIAVVVVALGPTSSFSPITLLPLVLPVLVPLLLLPMARLLASVSASSRLSLFTRRRSSSPASSSSSSSGETTGVAGPASPPPAAEILSPSPCTCCSPPSSCCSSSSSSSMSSVSCIRCSLIDRRSSGVDMIASSFLFFAVVAVWSSPVLCYSVVFLLFFLSCQIRSSSGRRVSRLRVSQEPAYSSITYRVWVLRLL
mmetsp:Transcript_13756/g.29902  ORF Transcript_13756/g.29902 Transcript_13756/m.29902 type:complete len:232 (-) Transcript_13756:238-933(-)